MDPFNKPIQGVGIGLRSVHYESLIDGKPCVPWLEVLTENYIHQGERACYHLEKIRERYPMTMHGVSLSIGSSDPLNLDYLKALKSLKDRFSPCWISDHLCWSSFGNTYVPDLLPLPYTEEALKHVVSRIHQVQDYLEERILIENVSSYLTYQFSALEEWEFLCAVASQADCYLLLDINNIYVSAQNHQFDPMDYLKAMPLDRVKEMHLAGYTEQDGYLLDTHGEKIHQPVWDLYKKAIEQFQDVPTLIEWDNNIPAFDTLLEEKKKADMIMKARHATA